jgi:membrane-bound lytic murein transglycosylase D
MAFRRFPGLRWLPVLAAVAGILAACSLGPSPAPTSGLQPTEPPKNQSVPEEAVALADETQASPLASPETSPPATEPPALSPLALAMAQAGSHYEQGIQALQSGNTDQAQWEFDAALETLMDSGPSPPASPALVGVDRSPPISLHGWLSPPVRPPQEMTRESAPEDPDEPTQEATALGGPEDVQEIETEESTEATPLPEPDVQKYEFPIVFNDRVKTVLQHFQTKKWAVITRSFERASRYLPMMRQVFREEQLPEELLNLAFIESAVNPWATSRVKAAGIWQFMASTGRLYGMQVSWWVDERRDPEKATRGAAAYLKKLHGMFGAWDLALAAYNAGEGKVQRAIAQQRTRDYWKLRLPKETQYFVPAFMAMTIISKEPERYGFSPPPDDPFETMTVTLDHPADFRTLAQVAEIPVEHLRELNPALIRWSTPPGASGYSVRVPTGVKVDFLDELARIPPRERVAWIPHRVRKSETATAIAKRYGANLQALLEMNGLKKRQALKPGASVLVPASAAFLPNRTADAAVDRPKTKTASAKPLRHTVKRGETVTQIARTYGLSPAELQRANGLSQNASLRPGQNLKLPAAATQERSRAARKNLAGALAGPLTAASERRYVVKRGDTLTEIARVHGVSQEDLRHWNGLERNALLQPGQTLRILSSSS